MDLKFSGNTADMIVKNCIKKLYKCFKEEATVFPSLSNYQTSNAIRKPVVNCLEVCLPRM